MTLDHRHILVALTEARQQTIHRLHQARASSGGWGTLRSAAIAQAALEVVRDYPDAWQLVLNQAQSILDPYEQEAKTCRAIHPQTGSC